MGEGAFHAKGSALEERRGGDQRIEGHRGARLFGAGAEEQAKEREGQEFIHPPMVGLAGRGRKLAPGDRLR